MRFMRKRDLERAGLVVNRHEGQKPQRKPGEHPQREETATPNDRTFLKDQIDTQEENLR